MTSRSLLQLDKILLSQALKSFLSPKWPSEILGQPLSMWKLALQDGPGPSEGAPLGDRRFAALFHRPLLLLRLLLQIDVVEPALIHGIMEDGAMEAILRRRPMWQLHLSCA